MAPAHARALRTCIACGETGERDALVRFVWAPPGEVGEEAHVSVAIDVRGSSFGRGIYVHNAPKCLAQALKASFVRAFHKATREGRAPEGAFQLHAAFASDTLAAIDARLAGFVRAAFRTGELAWGVDYSLLAGSEGATLLLAHDCGASILGDARLVAWVSEGRVLPYKTKAELGAFVGQADVSLCAIRTKSISTAFQSTYSLRSNFLSVISPSLPAVSVEGAGDVRKGETTEGPACKSPEVQ